MGQYPKPQQYIAVARENWDFVNVLDCLVWLLVVTPLWVDAQSVGYGDIKWLKSKESLHPSGSLPPAKLECRLE